MGCKIEPALRLGLNWGRRGRNCRGVREALVKRSATNKSSSVSYFDVFWVSAAVGVVLVFLVMLMRRSVAEKGAHLAAE